MHTAEKDQRWVFNEKINLKDTAPGVRRKVLAYCNEMMCVENHFEKDAAGALHNHPHTQITYVAEGKFRFTIGDETRIVSKGDTMLKQNGTEHGCVCLEKGVLIDFFTPMREDFISQA